MAKFADEAPRQRGFPNSERARQRDHVARPGGSR
jgi:hypothetical protein